ncbi:MAG: GNAT family N-acetyltransferase [Bdellovibrionales bacterium]|nr:GNAT family N-acetyltransferase [Bdellovibrionales bacterium]
MDIKIRNANLSNAKGIAKVHVKSWQETYHRLLPEKYLKNLKIDDREKLWKKVLGQEDVSDWLWVAIDEKDKIIGFCNGGKSRDKHLPFDCELYAIYLLSAYKGNGIGRQLFDSLKKKCISEGFKHLYLWILKGNPTVEIFKSLGGILRKDILETSIGGKSVKEVLYSFNFENKHQ